MASPRVFFKALATSGQHAFRITYNYLYFLDPKILSSKTQINPIKSPINQQKTQPTTKNNDKYQNTEERMGHIFV